MSANDRVYVANFDNVTIGTAVQDIFSLKASASNGIELHHLYLSAGGVSTATEIRVRLKRLPATVTQGSGGTVPTINTVNSGDTKAAQTVAHANDTTQATTSGTAAILLPFQWNQLMPLEYMPAPEDRECCLVNEAFVVDLPATIAATVVVSGFIKWAEVP